LAGESGEASTPRNPEVNSIWRCPMGVFTCEKCGEKVDTRCKPKKCPACSESGTMCKVEAPAPPKKGKK